MTSQHSTICTEVLQCLCLQCDLCYIFKEEIHCIYTTLMIDLFGQMIVYIVDTTELLTDCLIADICISSITHCLHSWFRAKRSTCSCHQRQFQFHIASRRLCHQCTCRSWPCLLCGSTNHQVCHYRSRILGREWWLWWWLWRRWC